MNGLVMRRCRLVKPWLLQRSGTDKAFEFLAYTLVLVQYLFQKNVQPRTVAAPTLQWRTPTKEYQAVSFIDFQDWCENASLVKKVSSGFWELAKQIATAYLALLKRLVQQKSHKPNVEALLQHCPGNHVNLHDHGILDARARVFV